MIRNVKRKQEIRDNDNNLFVKLKQNKLVSATVCLFLVAIILSPFYIQDSYAEYSGTCTSGTWYPKDSNTLRHIINRIYYTNSCSATACTVACQGQGGIYKDNLGATINGTLTMSGAASGSASGSHTYTYTSGGTNHTATYYNLGGAVSRAVTRSTVAQTVSCSHYVVKTGSSTYGGGKNCTSAVNITVPALDYYTVSYNCNSGEGCPATGGHYYGYTYTVPSGIPSRTGYNFNNYVYGSTTCSPGGACTINASITLTAQWVGVPYSIKFNSNGGTGNMDDLSMAYGTAKNLTANAYTKTGNNFVGWNTKADGSGTAYNNRQSVNNLTTESGSVITLYAQWEEDTPYTLTINSHGGTIPEDDEWTISGDTATKLVYYNHNYASTMPSPTKAGYTFRGWSYVDGTTYKPLSNIAGTGTQYIDTNYKPKSTTGVAVRYAFSEVSTLQQRVYGVEGDDSDTSSMSYSYYINGAGGMSYAYKNGTGNWVETGNTADTSSHIFSFNVKPGYWNMDSGDRTAITGTVSRTAKHNMTIMAARINDGTVNNYGKLYLYYFDIFESGTIVRSYVPCYRVSDEVVGLCDVLATNTTFYPNAGTGTFGSDKDSTYYFPWVFAGTKVHIAKNHTLHAIYSVNSLAFPDKTKTVGYSTSSQTINVDAAENGSGNTTYTKASGESNITVSNSGVITIPASKAAGTYTISIIATDSVTGATKTATYTIVVKNVFTVKFNANGGSGSMENQKFLFDEEKQLTPNTFTRTGYNFIGWNTSTDATGTWYMAENKVKNLSTTNLATVNLYAQWTEASDVTINKDGSEMTKDDYNNYILKNTMAVPYTVKYHGNGGYEVFGYDERISTSYTWTESDDGVWKSDTGSNTSDSSITSKTFTLTSADTLTFQWAVSCETYVPADYSSSNYSDWHGEYGGYLYYTITKDGETLSGTGVDTKITGNSGVTSESSLTYSTVTKSLDPGTYTISFMMYRTSHQTDAAVGLNQGFVKNLDLTNKSFYMEDQAFAADEKKALEKNKYVRPGYVFSGWSNDSSATENTYEDEEVVTLISEEPNSTVDLYAVWMRDPSYTVNVVVTNGSVAGSASQTVMTGSNGIFTLSPNTDYGYYNSVDGRQVGSVSCTNQHSATVSSDNITLTVGKGKSCYGTYCYGTDEGVQNDTTCTVTFKRIDNYTQKSTQNTYSKNLYTDSTSTCSEGGSFLSGVWYCCGTSYSFDSHSGKYTVNGTGHCYYDSAIAGKYCVTDISSTSPRGTSCTGTNTTMTQYTNTCQPTSSTNSACNGSYYYKNEYSTND